MISEQVEARMAAARAARNQQDKEHPMLINIKDFRLMPNVPSLRNHRNYRPYAGDIRATRDERQRIVETGSMLGRPIVVDTHMAKLQASNPALKGQDPAAVPELPAVAENGEPPFDVGKASREELCAFALRYYGADIDPDGKTHLATLRSKLRSLAEATGDMAKGDAPATDLT